jgi:lipopolysaccharide transport system ATP-binding protein
MSSIGAEALSKRYLIGHATGADGGLRHRLHDALSAPWHWARGRRRPPARQIEEFWALRDVSFRVEPGEVVGIIGRNGAGKSTLLKILSRITEPNAGLVRIRGRVASLLEVGTGFHPELTGRENVFLNGTILGMSRREIRARFDEIVAFAEVEQFIDTPVKRYSSGMYLRLAFAVAAHLESEILIVDEVLAVGDVAFQKKCMTRMGDVARGGRTILLVSHSLSAIESLCSTCLVLDKGRLLYHGLPGEAIERYLGRGELAASGDVSLVDHAGRDPKSRRTMQSVRLQDEHGHIANGVKMAGSLTVAVRFASDRPVAPVLGLIVRTSGGTAVFTTNTRIVAMDPPPVPCTRGVMAVTLPDLRLMPGSYVLDLFFGDAYGDFDRIEGATAFDVHEADVFGTGKLGDRAGGVVFCPASYELLDAH